VPLRAIKGHFVKSENSRYKGKRNYRGSLVDKASQCSEMRQTGWKRREMAFYARLKTLKVERKSK
jgi:hypothetical protein